MVKCHLVVDVNPKAAMISVRAESKLKVASLDDGDGWRGEDAVNRVQSAMKVAGALGPWRSRRTSRRPEVLIAAANVWISSLASTRRTI
jgi:hypothetical protein